MKHSTRNFIIASPTNTLAGRTLRTSLAILLLGGVASAQTTGTLSVFGLESPDTDIIISNVNEDGGKGTRGVKWQASSGSSLVGQSFLVPGSGTTTLSAIYLNLTFYYPKFPTFSSPAFSLKLFAGDDTDQNNTPLATFSYDTSTLPGDVTSLNWLRFGLDGGVSVTAGQTYSFLMVFDSESDDNYISFRRNKSQDGTGYADGADLFASTYAIDQWDTNPWNPDATTLTDRPHALNTDLWFHIEAASAGTPAGVKITDIAYKDTSDEISLWWDAEAGATYTVNWSGDLLDFTGEISNDVVDTATQPYTFASPSANADSLYFTVTKNAP